jgi:CBS domain-containing protein
LGFREVYRYTRGKSDWLASGLPREGGDGQPVAADLVTADIPTCHPDEPVDSVLSRVARRTRWCVVVSEDRVVLGLLPVPSPDGEPGRAVQEVMQGAPLTIRPHLTVKDAKRFAKGRSREPLLVTTSEGRLVGLLEPRRLRQAGSSRAKPAPVHT